MKQTRVPHVALAATLGASIFTSSIFVGDNVIAWATESPEDAPSREQSGGVTSLSYLSDLTPSYQQAQWGVKKNLDHEGRTININEGSGSFSLTKGVSAHAPATLEYNLDGLGVNVFETYLALSSDKDGEVEYKIYLDGKLEYASGAVRKNNAQRIRVNVGNAKKIKIEVDPLGKTSYDHAVLADAKVYHRNLDEDALKVSDVQDPGFAFDKMLDSGYVLNKDQYDFIQSVGRVPLFTVATTDASSEAFLRTLLENPEVLRYYNTAGNPRGNNKIGFVKTLKRIYDADPQALTDPDSQKIATAVALEYANGPIVFWPNWDIKSDAVERYKIYRDLNRTPGALMPIFKTLDVELMRNVVSVEVGDQDLIWLREKVKREKPLKLASNSALSGITHEYIAYNTYNRFGDWVQVGGYYGYNPSLATVIDIGGVCGSISKFGVVSLRAFGVPANVIGQPGHAAIVYMKDDGTWDRQNNISSWAASQGGTATVLAHGSGGNNASYNTLSEAARQHPEKYELAKIYYAQSLKAQGSDRVALWEKTLELIPEYVPVYRDMISDLNARQASSQEYYELSLRMLKTFRNYPKPLLDLLSQTKDKFGKKPEDYVLAASFAIEYIETVDSVTEGRARSIYDANDSNGNGGFAAPEYRDLYQHYSNLLGTFSFDGRNANRLVGARVGSEYSLDGGVSFKPVLEDSPLLPLRETSQITPEDGIIVRLKGMTKGQKIKFTNAPVPSNVKANDAEDTIIGLNASLEYSLDEGKSWISGDVVPDLSGNKTVQVRKKRTGTNLGSEPITLNFTASEEAPAHILHSNMEMAQFSSQQNGGDQAARNAIDGDPTTFWHTVWNRGDHKPFVVIKFDREYELKSFKYTPRQDSGVNGNIQSYKLLVSPDGKAWTEAYTGSFTYKSGSDKDQKTQALPSGIRGQYVRIEITSGVEKFASAADLSFDIDQEVANQVKKENDAKKAEALIPQYVTKLKELATELAYAQYYAAGQPALLERAQKLAEEVKAAQSLIDAQTMGEKLSEYLETFKNLNDEIIWEHNKTLSAQETAGVSGRFDEMRKINEQRANTFKQEKASLLALSESNVEISHYNDLVKARFEIKNLPQDAQNALKDQADHIERFIAAIGNKQEFKDKQTDAFKKTYETILTQSPESINLDNLASIASQVHQARGALADMPESLRTSLASEHEKLLRLQEKIASLEAARIIKEAKAYMDSHAQDFSSKAATKELWDADVAAARSFFTEAEKDLSQSSPEALRKRLFDLQMRNSALAYSDWGIADRQDRVDKFKRDFKSLLDRDASTITSQDIAAIDKAFDQFRRLDDLAQSELKDERAKLLAMNDAVLAQRAKGQEFVKDLLNKFIVNAKTSAAAAKGDDKTKINALQERAKSALNNTSMSVEEKQQLFKTLEEERMTIINTAAPAREKARLETFKLEGLMELSTGMVALSDEELVNKAKTLLDSLDAETRVYLADEIARAEALTQKIADLKDPNQASALEALAQKKKEGFAEVAAMDVLNDYERSYHSAAVEKAGTQQELDRALVAARKARDNRAADLRKKEDSIRQTLALVDKLTNPQNAEYVAWEPELTDLVANIARDYPVEYLNRFNTNENNYIRGKIEQRAAQLRAQNNEIVAQKQEKRVYEEAQADLLQKIAEAESRLESVDPAKKEELAKLVADAKYASTAALPIDELREYTAFFKRSYDAIPDASPVEPTPGNPSDTGEGSQEGASGSNTEKDPEAGGESSGSSGAGSSETPDPQPETPDAGSGKDEASGQEGSKDDAITQPETTPGTSEEDTDEDLGNDVCPIVPPAPDKHQVAVNKAIERINALEHLSDAEKQAFADELKQTVAGCDLNEIIIRAQNQDRANQEAKDEAEGLHELALERAQAHIAALEHLTDAEREEFRVQLAALELGGDTAPIISAADALNEKHKQESETPQNPPVVQPETPGTTEGTQEGTGSTTTPEPETPGTSGSSTEGSTETPAPQPEVKPQPEEPGTQPVEPQPEVKPQPQPQPEEKPQSQAPEAKPQPQAPEAKPVEPKPQVPETKPEAPSSKPAVRPSVEAETLQQEVQNQTTVKPQPQAQASQGSVTNTKPAGTQAAATAPVSRDAQAQAAPRVSVENLPLPSLERAAQAEDLPQAEEVKELEVQNTSKSEEEQNVSSQESPKTFGLEFIPAIIGAIAVAGAGLLGLRKIRAAKIKAAGEDKEQEE